MEDNNILVSIICTAYNHEKYIRDALEGFVMQKTNFKFEALVHDDASTDGTAAIIREYAEKYPDIIVPIIQTENQFSKKVGITHNILMPMAKGKYIAICEGDDFWTDENKLQLQVDFLESHPDYTACVHNSTLRYCMKNKKDRLIVSKKEEHDVLFEDVVWGMENAYQTSSLVVRREFVCTMPDFYKIAQKYSFGDFPRAIWYTIVGKVHFFPYDMSTYRLMSTPTSWSASTSSTSQRIRHKQGVIEMFEGVKNHVSDERKKLLDEVIKEKRFEILEHQRDYKKMLSSEFSEVWKKKSLKYRIKFYIKMLCPWLYNLKHKADK